MVVKVVTKKKLIDVGFPEPLAHAMANDMKWYELMTQDFQGILNQLTINNPYSQYDKFTDGRERSIVVGGWLADWFVYTLPELYQNIQNARESEIIRVSKIKGTQGVITADIISDYLRELQDWGVIPPNSPFAYLTGNMRGFINWNVNPFNQKNSDI
jgi:hypothetical protein